VPDGLALPPDQVNVGCHAELVLVREPIDGVGDDLTQLDVDNGQFLGRCGVLLDETHDSCLELFGHGVFTIVQ
jgi:hypothetical protein